MFTVGITTFDRGRVGSKNYFAHTWNSLVSGGVLNPIVKNIIISVGHQRDKFGIDVENQTKLMPLYSDEILPVTKNTHKLFREFLKGSMDYLILFQDDVLVCRNTFLELERWIKEENRIAVYPFATPYRDVNKTYGDTWNYPHKYFYMIIALVFHKNIVAGYLNSSHALEIEKRRKGVDLAIKNYLAQEKVPILAHCPNIAKHIGDSSALGHKHPLGSRGECDLNKSALKGTTDKQKKVKSFCSGIQGGGPRVNFRKPRVRV